MSIYINLASILVGLFIIVVTFKNMIQKKITEGQSIIWLLIGLGVIVLGIFPPLLKIISNALGIWYAPAILFAVAFVGLLLIVYHHTITISILNNKIQELSLQVALLKQERDEELRQSGECL